jgi:hypothetical protein
MRRKASPEETIMRKIRSCTAIAGLALLLSISSAAKSNAPEANKAIARRLFEVALNHDNWDVYDAIHSQDLWPTLASYPKDWRRICGMPKDGDRHFPIGSTRSIR